MNKSMIIMKCTDIDWSQWCNDNWNNKINDNQEFISLVNEHTRMALRFLIDTVDNETNRVESVMRWRMKTYTIFFPPGGNHSYDSSSKIDVKTLLSSVVSKKDE